jgi:hypothetical protein
MGIKILNEDMELDFSNMELLSFDMDDRVLHNADDASAVSFRLALGAEHTLKDDQMDTEVPGTGQATITSQVEAMGGTDST